MSGPFGSQQWMYNASSGFYPYELNNSLKFEDGDSSYLSRTPTSAGNSRTWTWSGWVKRGNLSSLQYLFSSDSTAGGRYSYIRFDAADKLEFYSGNFDSGTQIINLETSQVFRDCSSFYHIVVVADIQNATSTDRARMYVNGERVSAFTSAVYPPSTSNQTYFNQIRAHNIGRFGTNQYYYDGYMSDINFIDGQALDASSFGETKEGIWIPKDPTGLTYGTNGFYLPFTETTTANGFNTVTYSGNGATQSIEGVGFQPDLVWGKRRDSSSSNRLFDSVRGVTKGLNSNGTNAEFTESGVTSFDADGFTVGSVANMNNSSGTYVAWCWDAGTGSAASNTDGSITSTVKANQDYGFSIVSYTGTGSNATVGHGLGAEPKLIIAKRRSATANWTVGEFANSGNGKYLKLNTTGSLITASNVWNSTSPTSSVISVGTSSAANLNNGTYIAYCFADVSGYQKIGSYTGNGSSTGPTVTTGFKPAFVMIKRTDASADWFIWDNNRPAGNVEKDALRASSSAAEYDGATYDWIEFTSDGFKLVDNTVDLNASGGTYIYLAIAETRDAAFWTDASGNSNDWTPNDLQHSDVMPDTPTDGFATWNPLRPNASMTYAEGNLSAISSGGSGRSGYGTFGMVSGKWYFETLGGDNSVGVATVSGSVYATYSASGSYNINGSTVSGKSTYTTSDIISCAYDADGGNIEFFKNGVSQGSSSFTAGLGLDIVAQFNGKSGVTRTCKANFGQDSSFNATQIPQGNADDNGKGDFYYAPKSAHLALCNANLPDPAIDPNAGENPEDYFNTVLYSGNSGSGNAVTGVGFQPDWTWVKSRNTSGEAHKVVDSVRGAGLTVFPSSTSAEIDYSGGVGFDSFDADGFTVSHSAANNQWNVSGRTYVAWNWLAGGTGVSNTDGSITSTVSASPESGFSIVSYTTTATSSDTVGHGLSSAPELIFTKDRNNAINWIVFTTAIDGSVDNLKLNLTDAAINQSGSPAITATTFTTNYAAARNTIAYCFHSVEGYSKLGSYSGNSSADGTFVYTGFRPSFILGKKTSGSDEWFIHDNKRGTFNVNKAYLKPNSTTGEISNDNSVDFLSNGFKWRVNSGLRNASGHTYIYMAFAEQPFKYSNAR